MGTYASARKMKRTKRDQLQLIENANRESLDRLTQFSNGILKEFILLQKNFLAVLNILKSRGIVDDFAIHQQLQKIDEMETFKSKALIIDPNAVIPQEVKP